MMNGLEWLAASALALSVIGCAAPAHNPRSLDVAGDVTPTYAAAPLAQEAPASQAGAGTPAADGSSAADGEELAKQLANPIADLISLPIQWNYDSNIGPDDRGDRSLINIQPVIPFSLNDDWNVISRTILPVISQSDVLPGAGDQTGVGDIVQSVFFSPVESETIWGLGPVFLLPTASNTKLGAEKWALGPTGVVLVQNGPWTYGALANHLWSVAGESNRADINATFLQPFAAYTTPSAYTFTLQSESTYDWQAGEWAIPINALATKVIKLGDQLLSVGGGVRYWANSAPGGPEGFGARVAVTLLFPR